MRVYSAIFANKVEDTAIVDLVEIAPAANKIIEVIGCFFGQSSDFGDAQAEILPWKVSRGWTTSGSGGSALTIRNQDGIDTVTGSSVEGMNTTVAKEGTEEILHADTTNVMTGEKLWLPEGCGWKCSEAQKRLTIRLLTAPVDAITITGTVYFREL